MKKAYLLASLFSLGVILVNGSYFVNAQESPAPGQALNVEELLSDPGQQDAVLNRLKRCKKLLDLNCKILDKKGRKAIRNVVIQRLTDAQSYFNGACTNLKITQLVKKINAQKEQQERKETVAFFLELSMSLAHPWVGKALEKMIANFKPNSLEVRVLKYVAEKSKESIGELAKKLEDKVAKKSVDWLTSAKEENSDRIDLSNVNQFCGRIAGGFNVLIDQIRANLISDQENVDDVTTYSDLELLSMLLYYHPSSVNVGKYEKMLGDLFSRFELEVLSISQEDKTVYPAPRKGTPSEYDTSQKSLYIVRDENNNEFLVLIQRVIRQLDSEKISTTYTLLSGIGDDLKKFAIQRSNMLNIPIRDLDRELKSESNVSIKFEYFPNNIRGRYRSFEAQ